MDDDDDDDFEEQNADANIFKTEIDFAARRPTTSQTTKLPPLINIVALRETFLSEAPFVRRSNKQYWRKMIDSAEYKGMFYSTFGFIQSCIQDNGCVNVDKMMDIQENELVKKMSELLVELFFKQKPRERDVFFNRLPDLLFFMTINSLHSTAPRHGRVYNSVRFRELLLDWMNEIIGGVRLTNMRKHKEWLFADAVDLQIMVANAATLSGKANEAFNKTHRDISALSRVRTAYSIEHSPLINVFMNMQLAPPRSGHNALKISLSHLPDRPLVCLSDDSIIKIGKVRERHINSEILRETLKSSHSHRKALMAEYSSTKATFRQVQV